MVDIKVCLTVVIPGSTMINAKDATKKLEKTVINKKTGKPIFKNGKPLTKTIILDDWDKCDKNTLVVEDKKTKEKETLTFYTRKSIPAKQVINLSKDAYEYMISSTSIPSWSTKRAWGQLSKSQRLKEHLWQICQALNGKSYTFEVFD